jgi:hypothetical protein
MESSTTVVIPIGRRDGLLLWSHVCGTEPIHVTPTFHYTILGNMHFRVSTQVLTSSKFTVNEWLSSQKWERYFCLYDMHCKSLRGCPRMSPCLAFNDSKLRSVYGSFNKSLCRNFCTVGVLIYPQSHGRPVRKWFEWRSPGGNFILKQFSTTVVGIRTQRLRMLKSYRIIKSGYPILAS